MDPHKMGLRPTSPTRPITPDCHRAKNLSKIGMWQKLQSFFHRDGSSHGMESDEDIAWNEGRTLSPPNKRGRSSAGPVGVGLPRQATFKRQNSEKRERLLPVEPSMHERRALSSARPASTALTKIRSNSVPVTSFPARQSAPVIANLTTINGSDRPSSNPTPPQTPPHNESGQPVEYERVRPPRPPSITSTAESYNDHRDYFEDRNQLNRELDTKWILNLSMHFRDKSDREKFFVTYAETPSRWRRVTVSCDYRKTEQGSLERDLKELQLQRDKSMQIYEAIRDSLLDIKFYDTVTNLKLETTDGRLHVHVTEDVNEAIPYPPVSSLNHILNEGDHQPKQIRESELLFGGHLSGFVYKVLYKNKPYIKKEIPGPEAVDEFLYEVNALHALHDSKYVIDLEAIITDDNGEIVKGLLINFAERGAVVDLLYDYKGEIAWHDRERWAQHAIRGLSDIHEEGYVQGDFTLSNIVVDAHNNAQIIDINRRGCPVGWEPPELAVKIESKQRISMFIGQKSDLYQLGMTLWALAMDDDEPERHDPPLSTQEFPSEVPSWYQDIVRSCLSTNPRHRLSATDLVKLFPPEDQYSSWSSRNGHPLARVRTEKQYIDPAAAVERDDIERLRHTTHPPEEGMYSPQSSRNDYTFTWPQSSNYDRICDSASSEIERERPRGRRRISDYDSELRAQRNNEVIPNDSRVVNGLPNYPMPVISISGDGRESHVMDMNEEVLQMENLSLYSGNDDPTDEDYNRHNHRFTALSSFQDPTLFPDSSETSNLTHRNGDSQLFSSEANSPDQMTPTRQFDHVPGELAGLGTHHDLNEHNFGADVYQLPEGAQAGTITPFPPLAFADSGYDEPLAFGIGSDVDIATEGESVLDETSLGHQHYILPNETDDQLQDFQPPELSPNTTPSTIPHPYLDSHGPAERHADATESTERSSDVIIEIVNDPEIAKSTTPAIPSVEADLIPSSTIAEACLNSLDEPSHEQVGPSSPPSIDPPQNQHPDSLSPDGRADSKEMSKSDPTHVSNEEPAPLSKSICGNEVG